MLDPCFRRIDSTCCEATKPIIPQLLNPRSRACKLQLLSLYVATTEACVPSTCAPQREATAMRSPCTTTKSSPCSLQLQKACSNDEPVQPKTIKKNNVLDEQLIFYFSIFQTEVHWFPIIIIYVSSF